VRDPRPRRQGRPLQVELLDTRTLLSTLAPTPIATGGDTPAMATVAVPSVTAPAANLGTTLRGDYHSTRSLPDTGSGYRVYASGRAGELGKVVVTGTFHTPGNVAGGSATGTLRVSVTGGTLYLDLTGPSQSGFSAMPEQFNYTVRGGMGKFQGATGSGVATVNLLTPKLASMHGQGKSVITLEPTGGTWSV
jgi:hypothetical protein